MSLFKLISFSLLALVFGSVIASWVGIVNPIFTLNENQTLYLYSTTAQVMSGIYGLTLTGFIFFRNELSREEFEDETLVQAVESLKERYFKVLLFVTALSIFTILTCSLVISAETIEIHSLKAVFMNASQVSFIVNLVVIAYFIFDVVAPKRIERASKNIQEKYDPSYSAEKKGSLEEFLKNYNELEAIIQKYGQAYQSMEVVSDFRTRKRISNVRLAEFILRSERIDWPLFEKIRNLITLRNSIIHGAEPVVSSDMVDQSRDVLDALSKALELKI
ncbi:hypothetical protein IG528_17070 [Vibrio cholerae]|uniref:hypothetical protein n=1 Tax=Vibrio cholerae TaxID=666 RepID=UPI00226FA0A6|nr:hypothetical protein [Vibrio cholerae]MCX9515072.1 hypothetical protein [Vibrio cholerae]MCX9518627.1 hypothetical protein [Vibrio cholerae]